MVFYSRMTNHRRKKFAVITKIVGEVSPEKVIKLPRTPAASLHVLSLVKTQASLQNLKTGIIYPKTSKQKDGSVIIDYVKGDTFEKKIFEAAQKDDIGLLKSLLDELLGIINTWPKSKKNSLNKSYLDIFGNAYDSTTECSSFGLIDMNPGNLISTDCGIVNVDFEWFFHFPIPRPYLAMRLFYEVFSGSLAELFRKKADKSFPVLELGRDFIVPEVIYNHCKKQLGSLEEFYQTESAFQSYVHDEPSNPIGLGFLPGKIRTHTVPFAKPGANSLSVLVQENKELKVRLKEQDTHISRVKDELGSIKSSKSWKLIVRLNKLLRR